MHFCSDFFADDLFSRKQGSFKISNSFYNRLLLKDGPRGDGPKIGHVTDAKGADFSLVIPYDTIASDPSSREESVIDWFPKFDL